ncbi:MAG: non-canonical purine NTP pyrophosphatase [Gemmatimonadales bacterium]|nr:non-canonical purine NTP pyrophosphatase [Gemmatimonadales bacterium]
MRLLAATRSHGKQRELRRLLMAAGHEVLFPEDVGLPESADEAALEVHDSFEANARAKAEYFARRTSLPTVADDSGLEVLSLGGLPGVRSKRFAGASGTPADVDAANNAELLRRLIGAPENRRAARFRCCLVLLRTPTAVPEVFEGSCGGRILEQPAGAGGFGYDPLFFVTELGVTLAEASADQKDRVSHRGRAVAALVAALSPPEAR